MALRRIKDLRVDSDWTQQYVADLLHIRRSTYSAYENSANAVPIDILKNLALIYDTSTDYLLEMTDEKRPYERKYTKGDRR